MKKLQLKHLLAYTLLMSLSATLITVSAYGTSRLTSNDPLPVYLAGNPLGNYTYWENCDPEYRAEFGISFYRQSARKGRGNPFFTGTCDATVGPAVDCTTSCSCNKDIPLGDIHGRWNMMGLFYEEENDNSNVQTLLIQALDLTNTEGTGLTEEQITTCIQEFVLPSNSDSNKQFGFFSVPIEYRKHGIRFEADIGTCWDIGLRLQTGVASIRQTPQFDDLTCAATGTTCDGGACELEDFSCNCKKLVAKGIMKQKDVVADTLNLNIDKFCETRMEDLTVSVYWSRCFECNAGDIQNYCWPHYTFAPYLVGHFSAPLDRSHSNDLLFALPFGNNGHAGYGVDGGFNINFIESIQIGLEAGFTKFSTETYCNFPVPTNDLQTGMYPRKANVTIEPGTNWTFSATMGAFHFIECLSGYIQFQHVNHCCDEIKIIDTIPLTTEQLDFIGVMSDPFPKTNVKIKKMQDESKWNSSFVNVSLTYDISSNMMLGFFWQAPVRQEFAYRPTTVMGTLAFKF